jgi:hypothetical protein
MSITTRALVLVAVTTVAALVAAAVAYDSESMTPLLVVGVAWLVCTASAVVALVLGLAWHGTPNGVSGTLGGTLIGLGLPLALAILVQRKEGSFAQAGFYGWIVVFFLISLTAKTLLVAAGFAPADSQAKRRDDDLKSPATKSGV